MQPMRLAVLLSIYADPAVPLIAADPVPVDLYGDSLPAGAVARLGSQRFRIAAGRVQGLGFASNNRTLVVAGGSRLALFHAPTGKPMYEISAGEQWIEELRLVPGEQKAITLGQEFDEAVPETFYSLKFWDLSTRKLLTSFKFDGGACLQITPDGKTAITGNGAGMVHFWSLVDGKDIKKRHFGKGIAALAISPDGELLAVSSSNSIHFWKWRDKEEPVQVAVGRTVQSLAFSPDGSLLAEGPDGQTEIILRDVRTREVKTRLTDGEKNPMDVRSLAFSPDGQSLAGANSIHLAGRPIARRVHLWDVSTGNNRQAFTTGGDSPRHVSFSPNGRWLAAAGDDAIVNVWDLSTNKALDEGLSTHTKAIYSIHLSHDGRTAVTAGGDGTVRVWDAATGKQRHLMQHGNWVRGAALSRNGNLIASSSLDDSVRLWETESGKEVFRLPGHGNVGGLRAVAFSPDGDSFVSWGDHDSVLRRWDVRTGQAISERPMSPVQRPKNEKNVGRMPNGFNQAVFSPDARQLVFCHQNTIVIFDVDSGKEVRRLAHEDGNMIALAIGPETGLLATSAWGRPQEVALANGGFRSSAKKGHMVRVREVPTDNELFRIELPDMGAGPVAFSADGRLLAVAIRESEDSIQLLDARTGTLLQTMEGLPSDPSALAFSGDGKRLACAYGHGTALLWDLKISVLDK
jgi:WD40 repeat protein